MRVWLFNTNLKIPPREPIPHKWCDDRVLVCSKLQRSNDLCSLLHCVAQFTSMSSGQAVLRALVVVVVLVVTGLASFGQQMMIQKAQAAVQQAVWCVVVRCIRTIVLMCFAAQLSLSISFERRQQMLVTYLRVPLHVRKPVSAAILLASWCHILVSVLAGCCLMVFGMQISESCGRDGHVYTAENKLQDDNLLISNNSNSNSNSNSAATVVAQRSISSSKATAKKRNSNRRTSHSVVPTPTHSSYSDDDNSHSSTFDNNSKDILSDPETESEYLFASGLYGLKRYVYIHVQLPTHARS